MKATHLIVMRESPWALPTLDTYFVHFWMPCHCRIRVCATKYFNL